MISAAVDLDAEPGTVFSMCSGEIVVADETYGVKDVAFLALSVRHPHPLLSYTSGKPVYGNPSPVGGPSPMPDR